MIRYRCRLLVGLSGIVISIHPASTMGRSTWFLNLVLFVLPVTAISSVNARADNDFRRIAT